MLSSFGCGIVPATFAFLDFAGCGNYVWKLWFGVCATATPSFAKVPYYEMVAVNVIWTYNAYGIILVHGGF